MPPTPTETRTASCLGDTARSLGEAAKVLGRIAGPDAGGWTPERVTSELAAVAVLAQGVQLGCELISA
jgi:hypothetical protein